MKAIKLFFIFLLVILFLTGCVKNDRFQCVNDLDGYVKEHRINYAKESIIVMFEDDVSKEEGREIVQDYGLTVMSEFTSINGVEVKVPEGQEFEWICKLRSDDRVSSAELNKIAIAM